MLLYGYLQALRKTVKGTWKRSASHSVHFNILQPFIEKPDTGSIKREHLSSPQVFPRSVTDKVLPLTLQSIICLNLFLIYHIYLWVLFCVEVACARENDPLATPA